METKFTKGEWVIQNYNGKGSCIDIDTKIGNICQVYSLVETDYKTPHNEELIANAKLIAAAPDMFNALEELLAQVKQFTAGNIGEQDYFRDEISNAKKAIKKATE